MVRRWNERTIDTEESSKCLACDRYASAIFRALLVAEFGFINVADFFGVAGDKPVWGCLDRLEKVLKRRLATHSPVST